jgi:hypothetical protein
MEWSNQSIHWVAANFSSAMVDEVHEVHGMGGHHDDPPHHFCWKAPPNTIAMTEKESTNYTHYQVLGITSTASYEEIKVAYHKLARKSHPDKQQQESQNNTIDFKRIQLAWETLRNVEHRQVYDNDLQQEELRRKSRTHGALEITMNDLEEALDEESDETVLVYDCRCGEEVFIANWDNQKVTFVDCEGCCFVYKLCGKT